MDFLKIRWKESFGWSRRGCRDSEYDKLPETRKQMQPLILVREDAYRGCDVITYPYLENKGHNQDLIAA